MPTSLSTSQKGTSILPILIMVLGLTVGVYFIEQSTGIISRALEIVGPSKSATIKIPFRSPQPSQIATDSGKLATSSATPKASAAASASASVKPSAKASASASASPR